MLSRPERCLGCLACEVACMLAHEAPSGVRVRAGTTRAFAKVRGLGDGEVLRTRAYPVRCHQCEGAKCVVACATGAMGRTAEGVVLIDEERCTGCGICAMVCPYGAVVIDRARRKAYKHDLCVGRERPACVDPCHSGALMLGE